MYSKSHDCHERYLSVCVCRSVSTYEISYLENAIDYNPPPVIYVFS